MGSQLTMAGLQPIAEAYAATGILHGTTTTFTWVPVGVELPPLEAGPSGADPVAATAAPAGRGQVYDAQGRYCGRGRRVEAPAAGPAPACAAAPCA